MTLKGAAMKTIAIHGLAACLFMMSCGCSSARGPSTKEVSSTFGPSAGAKPEKQGAFDAFADEAFMKMFAGLEKMLPEGWAMKVEEDVKPPGDLWMKTLAFIYFKNGCSVHYGVGGQDTRKVYANLTLHFYRIEDRQKLAALEEPYREVSSHCPMDMSFAVTQEFFIAKSPCNRAFSMDESCNPPVEKLEKILLEHFGKKP
jgi:hypothetical protein